MSTIRTHSATTDLVSISERIRYMQIFRFTMVVIIIAAALLASDVLGAGVAKIGWVTAAYLGVSLAGAITWRLARKRALALFGVMLITDGMYLAWISFITGGAASPLRYFILLHLIVVALMASYRTGLKLALWHSLLQMVTHHAGASGIIEAGGERVAASDYQQLLIFMATFWFVAVATATFSAINERQLRRQRYDLERLAKMATDLEGADDPASVADVLLDTIIDAFTLRRALVLAAPEEDLYLMSHRGEVTPIKTAEAPGGASVIARARDDRKTLLVSELDPEADPWLAAMLPGARNVVVMPLSAEGGVIGVLAAEHSVRIGSRIERRVVSMLERFASHAGLALLNAFLVDRLHAMATTDGLTMIANRRTFDGTLKRELNRVSRSGEELSLLMLDIDHFKRLNDAHGHQKGDEVLRRVAGVLKATCRDFDTPARYGGEEFAVLVPGTTSKETVQIARRLKAAIRDGIEGVSVTVSMGVASFPANADDNESLVAAADAALYESKHNGRNRITASKRVSKGREPVGLVG